MPSGPLAGVVVTDVSTGPCAGLAATVLADFGATVVKVEPPGGDRFRSMASSPMWLRGRRSVVADLNVPEDLELVQGLARLSDVVLATGPLGRLAGRGLDARSLRQAAPGLVHCTITGFGAGVADAELVGHEGIVAARCGRMSSFGVQLDDRRPVYSAVPVATHIAAQAAVQGIVSALIRHEATGQGAAVRANLASALMVFDLVDLLNCQLADARGDVFTPLRRQRPMPTLNYHPLPTADGRWVQCGNLLEHLFISYLDAADLLGELLVDERFQSAPGEWSPEAIEHVRDRMIERSLELSGAEWMQRFIEHGNVAAEVVREPHEAFEHPDLQVPGALVRSTTSPDDADRQPGAIAELSRSPATVATAHPRIGDLNLDRAHTLLGDAGPNGSPETTARPEPSVAANRASASAASTDSAEGRPLAGVTVVDLSTIIAGPLAAVMLADLGARVIKVEPPGGDPFRHLMPEGRMAVKTNLGKESIVLDLKTEGGQRELHELVKVADVVMHNFRAGVPERLGLSPDQLEQLRPGVVVAVINGYGPDGPSAQRAATHPVMGALSGGVARQAGELRHEPVSTIDEARAASQRIMAANEANPDPNTSAVAASAILLAILHQRRTGEGQVVRVNMHTANLWANFDAVVGEQPDDVPGHDLLGTSACARLYEAADGWVFLVASCDAEFERVCTAFSAPDVQADPRFASAAGRQMHDAALTDAFAAAARALEVAEIERRARSLRAPVVRADQDEVGRWLLDDPISHDEEMTPFVEHATFGRHRRWGQIVTVDGPNSELGPSPLIDEHASRIRALIASRE